MLKRLTRPFTKRIDKLKNKVHGFVNPIKEGIANLRGKLPSPKAFAGSEDAAEPQDGEPEQVQKLGLVARLKKFKKSLNEMSDFQKIILLVIAVCLPAGILIATVLVKFLKNRKKK